MTGSPPIDVVVICHNQERFIGGAIDSVLEQTRIDAIDKVIVVDDGSTDASAQVIRERAARHGRVLPLYQAPSGTASGARNAGIERTTASYVAFLDGDDLWLPGKVDAELNAIRQHPGAGIYYSGFMEVTLDGQFRTVIPKEYRISDRDSLERFFLKGAPIIPSAALVLRKALATCGTFDERLRLAEDQDLWLRLMQQFRIQIVPDVTVHKRVHPESLSTSATGRLAYLDNCEAISERMYEAEPRLRRVASLRAGRISRSRLLALLRLGDSAAARREAWRVLRLTPLDWRSWAAAGLALLGRTSNP